MIFRQEKRNKGKRRTLNSNNNMLIWFSKPSQTEEVKDIKYVTLHCKRIVGSVSEGAATTFHRSFPWTFSGAQLSLWVAPFMLSHLSQIHWIFYKTPAEVALAFELV